MEIREAEDATLDILSYLIQYARVTEATGVPIETTSTVAGMMLSGKNPTRFPNLIKNSEIMGKSTILIRVKYSASTFLMASLNDTSEIFNPAASQASGEVSDAK